MHKFTYIDFFQCLWPKDIWVLCGAVWSAYKSFYCGALLLLCSVLFVPFLLVSWMQCSTVLPCTVYGNIRRHSKAFVSCPLVHSFFIILKAFIFCVRYSDNCLMWSSHLSFSSSTIPRNLAQCTRLTVLLLILMVFNQSGMFMFIVWKMLYWVLLRFTVSLLSSSHLSIRHIAIFSSFFSVFFDWLVMNMLLSSANSLVLWLSGRQFGISFVYSRNKSGPSTDPCGTP